MMNETMGSGMMWGMGAAGLILVVVVLLIIAALINTFSFNDVALKSRLEWPNNGK